MPPLRNTGSAPEAERPDYAGRYQLEAALGSGGMGEVHLATSASGLRLAVKVIHVNHASDPEFRARFRQEVAAARRVSGAFTAPVVDADPEAERPWMATLFIDGPTLAERVKRNGPLNAGELARLGAGLAEGLRDIHRAGVVHRDLKPSNVLLASDGPKVIDFGISRPADSDLRTETGKLIGTPPFMAPEQFQRPREVGPAADVFAMGAVLVHAATGRGPFDSDSPYIVAYQVVHNEPDLAGVPESLLPLVTRCLSKEPEDRPTPDELMAALRTSAQGKPESPATRGARGAAGAQGARSLIPAQRRWPEAAGSADSTPTNHSGHADQSGHSGHSGHAGGADAQDGRSLSDSSADRAPADDRSADDRFRTTRLRAGRARTVPSPGRRLPRTRRLAAGVAVVALAVAGFAGVRAATDDDAAPAPPSAGRADEAFRPWQIELGGGKGANRMPVCSADGTGAGTAVYCTAPGVKAARISPADGKMGWSVPDTHVMTDADEGAAPVVSGGLLHVITPGGSRLEALDPGSGAERWSVDISSYATVRHAADSVLLVSYDGLVRSLDGATGAERWEERRGGTGSVWTAGGGADGLLFAATPSPDGTATEVSAIDPADGTLLWEKRLTGMLTPAGASDGALFLLSSGTNDMTDAVVRLDASSRVVRRVPLPSPVDQAQATVAGDLVYVVGYTGSLLAVDTSDGSGAGPGQRWRLETSVTRASRPTAAGTWLFMSAGDGRLLAVDARRGVLMGQTKPRMGEGRDTLSGALPMPVTVPGKVLASAPDGSVFAVDSRDPARW
ncbi:serine/threonine-protein kinase [Streptomyces sp. MnatMP-M17]|uniref:serine/threonine-protein kinase n=1 Tax=unclassified Streptomyces TaxID=2593676 RepID=UPI00081DA20C|nr:serine/threonine-protein kinase [Streptomyces sp. MnatMP-M17]MYZ37235.1 PQQ-binding-like beta-propeller repeat protein [Streptomyces sp. SID4917]SCF89835.1 Serine/threonine protein kinase [Streptomyces sp. MnatMP-M17]